MTIVNVKEDMSCPGFSVSGIITLRRLIWVDTLRRAHNVGFLAGRLL